MRRRSSCADPRSRRPPRRRTAGAGFPAVVVYSSASMSKNGWCGETRSGNVVSSTPPPGWNTFTGRPRVAPRLCKTTNPVRFVSNPVTEDALPFASRPPSVIDHSVDQVRSPPAMSSRPPDFAVARSFCRERIASPVSTGVPQFASRTTNPMPRNSSSPPSDISRANAPLRSRRSASCPSETAS